MWSSSELSISRSMPVIFPARLGCMFWISGKRRSPRGGHRGFKTGSDLGSPSTSYWDNTCVLYNTKDSRYGFLSRGRTCFVLTGVEWEDGDRHCQAYMEVLLLTLTQHLLLFLWWSSSQHGGRQRLLSLNMNSRLKGRTREIKSQTEPF